MELQLTKTNDDFSWCEINLTPYYDEQNIIIGISGTIDDISVRKTAEERLTHVALHDTLTGIHNRYYFDDELENISNTAKRSGNIHSLLYIDLDHFKVINDSQGHHQGDLVLKEIAHLLSESTRKSDVLCRIGGDEFALLLTNTTAEGAKIAAIGICQKIADTCFQFSEEVYRVSCSIGISEINGKARSSEIYLQQADIAMFAAKEKGRNRAHVFKEDDKITDELKQSFEWSQKLQKALIEDNIVLHFQPIIDLSTLEIKCYEALVRLIVDGKMISPNDFIPSLEKAEDMNLLDRHVIGKALSLMQKNPVLIKLAINLSAQAFTDDRLFDFIADKLALYNIEPSNVVFELTESASLSNITGTQRMVNKLNELGCHFSIDDFGTGFSTFAYLKQIPAGSVKIDGSFVKDMLKDPIDEVLVKAINETAHALSKTTVAEFVEDQATLERLAELGVNYAQGYHIGKPMDIEIINAKEKLKLSGVSLN
jgi:diguanylate cyclase (GGDEF)-like protein